MSRSDFRAIAAVDPGLAALAAKIAGIPLAVAQLWLRSKG